MVLEEFLGKYHQEINSSKIFEIVNQKVQGIKKKYWDLKYKAFLDENVIREGELN